MKKKISSELDETQLLEARLSRKYNYLLGQQKKLASLNLPLNKLPIIKYESEFLELDKHEAQILSELKTEISSFSDSLAIIVSNVFLENFPEWVDNFLQKMKTLSSYIDGYLNRASENYAKRYHYYLHLIYLFSSSIDQFARFKESFSYFISKHNLQMISTNKQILTKLFFPLASLPLDIILYLFNFLDLYSLKSLTTVNKQLYNLRTKPSYIVNFFSKGYPQEVSKADNEKAVIPTNQNIFFVGRKFMSVLNSELTLLPDFRLNERAFNLLFNLVKDGNLEQIQLFFKRETRLNPFVILQIIDSSTYTPLHWASFFKHQHLLDYFYNACIDYCERHYCEGQEFPFQLAYFCNQQQVITEVLLPLLQMPLCYETDVLHYVTEFGHVNIVQLLIEKGFNPLMLDANDNSPLHLAVKYGHLDVVKLLLNYFVDILQLDQHKNSVLEIAAFYGHMQIVDFFLQNFVGVWQHVQTKSDGTFDPHSFLPRKTQSHIQNNILNSALKIAATRGFPEVVALLLNYNSDMNDFDNFKNTVLSPAVKNGRCRVVDLLIRRAGNSRVYQNKETALPLLPLDTLFNAKRRFRWPNTSSDREESYYSILSCQKTIELLLKEQAKQGVDTSKVTKILEEFLELLIIGKPVRFDDPNDVLQMAVIKGNLAITKLLLELGFDANYKDQDNWTLLDYAVYDNQNVAMIILLLSYGAEVNKEYQIHSDIMYLLQKNETENDSIRSQKRKYETDTESDDEEESRPSKWVALN